MPLFGTDYEVETDPDKMSWEAILNNGTRVFFTPHLCSSHADIGEDHRGWIDVTILEMTVIGFYLPPQSMTLSLTHASIFIEGLREVAQWAHLNQGLDEGD